MKHSYGETLEYEQDEMMETTPECEMMITDQEEEMMNLWKL